MRGGINSSTYTHEDGIQHSEALHNLDAVISLSLREVTAHVNKSYRVIFASIALCQDLGSGDCEITRDATLVLPGYTFGLGRRDSYGPE